MNAGVLLRALLKRGRNSAAGGPVPSHETAYCLAAFDLQHIGQYKALLGFAGDEIPVTYYYLLAQRAHLATMLGDQFPFALAGMVHVENELFEHAAPRLDRHIDLLTRVTVEDPTDTGARYCWLETVAEQDRRRIFSCRSKYLARRGSRKPPTGLRSAENTDPVIARWALAPSSGRDYASVSGDWNPIHLWAWSARLMGMKAPIIHGMHTVAKACAAIEALNGVRVASVTARFKAPIPLGAQVSLAVSPGGADFSVLHHGRVAVQGTLGPAWVPADAGMTTTKTEGSK